VAHSRNLSKIHRSDLGLVLVESSDNHPMFCHNHQINVNRSVVIVKYATAPNRPINRGNRPTVHGYRKTPIYGREIREKCWVMMDRGAGVNREAGDPVGREGKTERVSIEKLWELGKNDMMIGSKQEIGKAMIAFQKREIRKWY